MHQFCRISHRFDHLIGIRFTGHKLPGSSLAGPVEVGFSEILLAVLFGRAGAVFLEKAVKIAQVVESRFKGHQFDRIVCIEQQFTCMADAHVDEKLGKAAEGVFLKEMAES